MHDALVEAGNVRAVFAGHIHRMRHDGFRDGIEYVTLATTGGSQNGRSPSAGYLHHFHMVTVREDRISLAALPVSGITVCPATALQPTQGAGPAPCGSGPEGACPRAACPFV